MSILRCPIPTPALTPFKGRESTPLQRQAGAAAVELALIIVLAFLPLLLGILEVSRLFYVSATVQEVTRRAAREQVVNWISDAPNIKRAAVFQPPGGGTVSLPGGHEVTNATVRLTFHNTYADASDPDSSGISSPPASAQANVNTCLLGGSDCIQYVRATLEDAGGDPVTYTPMTGWFGDLFALPLPGATVIMPAEALGLL